MAANNNNNQLPPFPAVELLRPVRKIVVSYPFGVSILKNSQLM